MMRQFSKRLAFVLTIAVTWALTVDAQVAVSPVAVSPYSAPVALEVPIETFRRSFYQGTEVLGGYYRDTGDKQGGLDFSFQEVRASFGFPLGSMDNVIGFRPYFRATQLHSFQLNGITPIDLPETLYRTGVTFLNQRTWSCRLSTTLVASPEIRSDFSTDKDAFRIFGLALANWKWSNHLTVSAGGAFLDREDVGVVPVFGFVWTPTPDFKVNAMIPKPRIAKRLWKNGGIEEGWVYIGAEFGGNSWAVTRVGGPTDVLTMRDYRLLAGYEVLRAGNRGATIECGYSFGRTLEYASDEMERDLDDALFVQGSLKF